MSETDFHGRASTHMISNSLIWGGGGQSQGSIRGGFSWYIREPRRGL